MSVWFSAHTTWSCDLSCLSLYLVSFSFLFYNPCSHVSGVGLAVCVPESNHPHSHLHTSPWLGEFHQSTGPWNTPHNRHGTSTKSVYPRISLFMFCLFQTTFIGQMRAWYSRKTCVDVVNPQLWERVQVRISLCISLNVLAATCRLSMFSDWIHVC